MNNLSIHTYSFARVLTQVTWLSTFTYSSCNTRHVI